MEVNRQLVESAAASNIQIPKSKSVKLNSRLKDAIQAFKYVDLITSRKELIKDYLLCCYHVYEIYVVGGGGVMVYI